MQSMTINLDEVSEQRRSVITVSVVIPTKNRADFVAATVESIFAGTYTNFEVFVVDQSTDSATADILNRYAQDKRFHYIQNRKPGVGAASSRNIGIALSKGEIVAITDDDVAVRPDWMATLAGEFESDPDLQFVCGRLTAPPYDHASGFTPEFNPEPPPSNWRLPLMAAGANFCMRRSLFDRIGGYDEFCGPGSRLGASDDGDISFRIMRSGAKWKGCPAAEVVHTFGFRPGPDGVALLRRYQLGNGGNYGRHTRRGDLLAGLWFLAREFLQFLRIIFRSKGSRAEQWKLSLLRLRGFWNGLQLSPKEGFVSGRDLERIRTEGLKEYEANKVWEVR